jgi:hypothetical protein
MPETELPTGNGEEGARLSELADLLCSAFDDFGLEELVSVTLGQGLFKVYAAPGTPLRQTAYRLLQRAGEEGTTEMLLRGVLARRPNRPDLRPIIGKHYPQALLPMPVTRAQVSDVVDGLEAVKRRSADPAVNAMVTESRAELERVNRELHLLARYKNLHDALHLVQLRHLRVVTGAVRRLRTDPTAGMELTDYVAELQIHAVAARGAAEGLPDGTAREDELAWVTTLEAAVTDLRTALDTLDDRTGALAVANLKQVLRVQPFRINQHLTSTAQRLPLTKLIAALQKIASTTANGEQQRGYLDDAITSLQALVPDLLGCVHEHRLWQEVENDLWLAQTGWEQGATSDALGDFWIVWPRITERVATLSAAYTTDAWAVRLNNYAAAFKRAFPDPANVVDLAGAQAAFDRFRHDALFRFYLVDKTLKDKCGAITAIGQPLDDLLREVARGAH